MNEQLRELVSARLADAVDCPAKEEIVEEITADLAAKYADLLDSGLSPEEAFSKVASGIGDLGEVVSFINEANRCTEEASKTSDNPFAGLENLLRQMGKSFKGMEPDLREVASDLKSAAGHLGSAAKNLAQDAKETIQDSKSTLKDSKDTLKDIAHSVRSGLKSTAKTISNTVDANKHRYDYTVPTAGINNIEIQTSGGDISFGVSQDDNIYIVELSKQPLTEDKLASIQTENDCLTIAQGQKYSAGSLLFHYGMLSSDFEIYLPQRPWNNLKIATVSGDVELEKGMEVAHLEIETSRGDVEVPELTTGVVHIETVNGDVALSGSCCELDASTVNGDLQLNLYTMPNGLCVETVNGDVSLQLPDNDGFSLEYHRVNGDILSDFDLKTSLNARDGVAVYREGGDRKYRMTTVNGDLRIRRR